MYKLPILLLFIFSTAFAQDDEIWSTVRANEARGFDSLVGMPKAIAMPLLSKFHIEKLSGHCYPYIKEVYKIEHFNKWQHLATLYIFIDSANNVRKLNYFFTDSMPIEIAKKLEDSVGWGLPIEKYPEPPAGMIYEDGPGPSRSHHFSTPGWSGRSWQGSILNRLLWQHVKSFTKVIYLVAINPDPKYDFPHNGEMIQDNIYEPIWGINK